MDPSASQPPSFDRYNQTPGMGIITFRALQSVISVGIVLATLFTIWTPTSLFSTSLAERMNVALSPEQIPEIPIATPTGMPTPRVGIVAGHWGNDSGAVCPDGLTEADINLKIATLVMQNLVNEGYEVDLLKEWDTRLYEYQAMVLVSIHNDSCAFINDEATGFKVSSPLSSAYPEQATRLTSCLIDRYQAATSMHFHFNSITPDMTEYHAFDEIHTGTTAAIIETGFLNLDRQILTEQPELVAKGITNGILCYIRNESVTKTTDATNP